MKPSKHEDYTNPSVIMDDFLYHGNLKNAMNKTLLEELGIRRIVNVCEFPLEEEILDQRHVLWIRLDDDTYTDIAEHFDLINNFIQSCKVEGQRVLIHCQLGVSRSSAIVLAYLMK